ncbi:ATP-binding protein [Haliscomenobacter hydrossis]|uniref:histidine kinase n=1 Tax=Haliscomenobacter hydrossis (strain ATCC 27775 / DSM 1100 / LMG 10767 / O) TaxID=760192 RepID=F4L0Q0_HALH1|nr:ATP-binding protein [Haliscomenobacter hydrossis]AEE49532.1 Hpt sensor hybrid histidine kinase [Haliscomenobacter hydrossis DSM 1100]
MWVGYSFFILLIAAILYRNSQQKSRAVNVFKQALIKLEATQIQLIAQKERAEQSEKFKQRFLAHMSHEIRTPLHGIAGFTDLLLETSLSEKQRRWLSSIYHSTERLDEVVNAVLELSKLEAGELKLRKIPFSPAKVAADVQESLSLRAQNKGINLLLDVHKNVPGALRGDPTRLYQILMNLTGNAVKFTEKGSVTIKMDCAESIERTSDDPATNWVTLILRIIDTGIGIPAEKITAVFDSFEQAGEDMVARYGGTGLGLTVTQELVQLHGGDIQVESALGVGTTFTVKLPFALAAIEELKLENQDVSALYFAHSLNILLVDDNELNREIAYEAIHRHFENARITEAVNGKEAIETLENQNFDVILMDMQMPEMSGTEAARRIREFDDSLKRDLPIIALTASATPEEIEKALESGMDRHLGKPFKPHQLAQVMAETLGLKADVALEKKEIDRIIQIQDTPLDLSFLRDFTDGDVEQMQYFIQKFLHQCPLEIQKLEQALVEQDKKALFQTAHSFKPQLEFVGLKKAAALAQQLEQAALKEAPLTELSTLLSQLKETLNELPVAEEWLNHSFGQ